MLEMFTIASLWLALAVLSTILANPTGLTFGSISALYGLTHGIITREQYSFIIAAIIASAVIPTIIANMAFLPSHLLHKPVGDEELPQLDLFDDKYGSI